MLGIAIGLIIGIMFFTYKPFFIALKLAKFNPKELFLILRQNKIVRAAFKDFSAKQLERLQSLFGFAFKQTYTKDSSNITEQSEIKETKQELVQNEAQTSESNLTESKEQK